MAKLTNSMRERIAKAVLKHRFAEIAAGLVAERAAFALTIYNDVYSEAERRKMAALPAGWLCDHEAIGAQFGGGAGYAILNFNGSAYGSSTGLLATSLGHVTRRLPYTHRNGCAKVYETASALSTEHFAQKERLTDLNKQVDTAGRQINAALAQPGTTDRLIELWPEVEPFVKKLEPTAPFLPSIPVARLNAMFGLPVTEAA